MSTSTIPRQAFDLDVEQKLEDVDEIDFAGWFCIATKAYPCPASGCDFVALYVTAAHLIVVWPRLDDRALLEVANDAKRLGRNPSVREYESSFGPCVAYDAWQQIGRPVHGLGERPEGIPWRDL